MLTGYRFLFIVILLAVSVVSNCAGFEPTQVPVTATLTPILQITPYWTPTSSPTTISPTPASTPTATSLPTPTPFTHTIVEGDMLGGIALQYGLTVEDLLAANPDVDPGFLRVGSTVVVPLDQDELLVSATPVAMPIQIETPNCYPIKDGGGFCLMLATNEGETGVENLSAKIGLISKAGESVAEEIALPPLNVLPAGESLPVLAYFPNSIQPDLEVRGEVVSALPILEEDTRYLMAGVELEEVIVEPDGKQAAVLGQVVVLSGSEPPDYLWVAAVAYGKDGEVIGLRKWEAPEQQSCPELKNQEHSGVGEVELKCISFDLTIYSLGPEIERVEVFAEAGYQSAIERKP
jgi:LysM repeat protein